MGTPTDSPSFVPGEHDPSPAFLCRDLSDSDETPRYRVPVQHVMNEPPSEEGRALFDALPNIRPIIQLAKIVGDGSGYGLFAPSLLQQPGLTLSTIDEQRSMGSMFIYPPVLWKLMRERLGDWLGDPPEVFARLPYGLEDLLPFAGIGMSADFWLIVMRGPAAGRILSWGHDGEGDASLGVRWAENLNDWARRIRAELPGNFGGTVRFTPGESIDNAPADAELYPEVYLPDINQVTPPTP